MKAVFATGIILIIFFAGAIIFQNSIQETCRELTSEINKLQDYIAEENWIKAQEAYDELNKLWEERSKFWVIFLEHYNIDSIETTIGRIEVFSKLEDKTMALGEVVKLRYLIKQVADREAFVLSNLL